MAKRDTEIEPMDEELVEAAGPDGRRAPAGRARGEEAEPRGHRRPDANSAAPPRKHRNRRLGQLPGADLHHRLRQELRRRGRPRPHRDRRPAPRGDGRAALHATHGRGVRARRSGADHAQMAGDHRDRRGRPPRRRDELAQPSLARAAVRPSSSQRLPRAPARTPLARAAQQSPAPTAQGAGRADRRSPPAWIQVTDQGKTLFEGMLQPGQTYHRAADRDRADAQGRQARSAQDHGRLAPSRRRSGRRARSPRRSASRAPT